MARLIDADKLEQEIRERMNNGTISTFQDFFELIDEQPTVNTWIKYDRNNPPKNKTTYICAVLNNLIEEEKVYQYATIMYDNGWNCITHSNGRVSRKNEIKTVVAYMPIPEYTGVD